MKKFTLFLCILFSVYNSYAQNELFEHKHQFTRQDTLKGTITPERAWWNLKHYHLKVAVHPETKSLKGSNTIQFEVLSPHNSLQIDLMEPLQITKAIWHKADSNIDLNFHREGHVYWLKLPESPAIKTNQKITVYYEGQPTVSKNPPWSGGIVWKKDQNGNDFIATANQGIGASVWWPNKDHDYDEPDLGMKMSVTVPEHLTDVSNGRLLGTDHDPITKTKTFHWEVKNPINNYGVNLNIGDYVHFSEVYKGLKGDLDCDYWVLRYNLEKAKKQFKQGAMTLEAFEHWFGPYPFYEDSYKLVEAPYLGMEHQSSVTYGNNYNNGYLGRDLSGTGVGLKFDFIIVHESGHEWFANSITNKDVADMWIHESFTAYSETLFVNYHFSKKEAEDYVIGTRRSIQNDRPIIGVYNMNHEGSGDMYYKGANMLHTIRQMVNDDKKWRQLLLDINKTFYHQQITTTQMEQFIMDKTGLELHGFFDQYLRTIKIPEFTYSIKKKRLEFSLKNAVSNLKFPIKVWINGEAIWLKATTEEASYKHSKKIKSFEVDRNYYVNTVEQKQ